MDSILESHSTSTHNTEFSDEIRLKTASAPVDHHPERPQVKPQISAPSYLFSLKDNESPPFLRPGKEAKPKLLIGTIMDEDEAIEMIAASDSDRTYGLRMFLGKFLVDKKIIVNYNISERAFLISFLCETIDYAAQRDFSAFKLACLITIYLDTHLYFKWYYWTSPLAIWHYFKETMIRHTIEDSPDGQEVFEPEECYDILSHFHTIYLSNLPLVHIVSFGSYRLKLLWPFKPK